MGEMLPKLGRGVCGHPPLWCTRAGVGHAHAPPGWRPAGVTHPAEWGHACGAGMQHACAGTHGAAHGEVADTPVSTDGHRAQVRIRRLQTHPRRAHPGRCPAPAAVGIPYPWYPFPRTSPAQILRLCHSLSPLHPTHSINSGGCSGAARGG